MRHPLLPSTSQIIERLKDLLKVKMLGIGRPRNPIQVSLVLPKTQLPGKLPVFWEETPEVALFFLRVRPADFKL